MDIDPLIPSLGKSTLHESKGVTLQEDSLCRCRELETNVWMRNLVKPTQNGMGGEDARDVGLEPTFLLP